MGVDEAMRVAGIGCRKGVAAADVLAAIDAVLAERGLSRTSLDALATVTLKANEPGLRDASEVLGLPLIVPSMNEIDAAAARTITHSATSQAVAGAPCASEAAALAATGPNARLLGERRILGNVTCAIAVSEDTP
jgi:cobalt-precorrin 5A hydrolase